MAQFAAGSKKLDALCREYRKRSTTVHLQELVGGALSFYAAAAIARCGGVHLFVAEDRDAAAYLLNDFYNLLDEERVCFFPSSYKHSAANGAEDAQGGGAAHGHDECPAGPSAAQRGSIWWFAPIPRRWPNGWPMPRLLQRKTIAVRVGARISIEVLEQELVDGGFTRVDFVYEPGQYSLRGGIVDVFSYSESKPYRLDFFGDEGRLDPAVQHLEPAVGRQARPRGDHP